MISITLKEARQRCDTSTLCATHITHRLHQQPAIDYRRHASYYGTCGRQQEDDSSFWAAKGAAWRSACYPRELLRGQVGVLALRQADDVGRFAGSQRLAVAVQGPEFGPYKVQALVLLCAR